MGGCPQTHLHAAAPQCDRLFLVSDDHRRFRLRPKNGLGEQLRPESRNWDRPARPRIGSGQAQTEKHGVHFLAVSRRGVSPILGVTGLTGIVIEDGTQPGIDRRRGCHEDGPEVLVTLPVTRRSLRRQVRSRRRESITGSCEDGRIAAREGRIQFRHNEIRDFTGYVRPIRNNGDRIAVQLSQPNREVAPRTQTENSRGLKFRIRRVDEEVTIGPVDGRPFRHDDRPVLGNRENRSVGHGEPDSGAHHDPNRDDRYADTESHRRSSKRACSRRTYSPSTWPSSSPSIRSCKSITAS